ncbi:MAG: hypothetical protein KC561_20815 [Myxococcales bacterium]|nr:hypothetical protein [Myxococcales bacterium]
MSGLGGGSALLAGSDHLCYSRGMIERITHEGQELAIIIRASFAEPGLHFFTEPTYSQQLAYMRHPKDHIIQPHVHNEVQRTVRLTQEVLVLRRGRLRVDFYTDAREYLWSRTLSAGDVILLAAGGHGFECLDEVEMIEVKQGPYSGDADKTRFEGVNRGETQQDG